MDVPYRHPYNTTYFPCNASAELFQPRGMTRTAIGRAIIADPSLGSTEIVDYWADEFFSPSSTPAAGSAQASAPTGNAGCSSPAAPPSSPVPSPDEEEKRDEDSSRLDILADAVGRMAHD